MYIPNEKLKDWIKVFWFLEGNSNQGLTYTRNILPDGCATITFVIQGNMDLTIYKNGKIKRGIYIIPPVVNAHYDLISDDIFLIDIQLNPGIFNKLFNLSVKELENRIYSLDESIKKIDEMQNQINIFKNEIENQLKIIEEKDEKIKELENQNKALQEQNNVLLDENINLQNKINSRANMSDYEDFKKENESLKNENSFLKSTITKIINFANNKIKDFFKFKIYNDVIFKYSDDHLLLEDWEDRCNDRYKLETEYNKQIENELLKEQDFGKEEDANKINLSTLEKLNKNLDEFVSPEKKKEDIEQFNNYDSFLNR